MIAIRGREIERRKKITSKLQITPNKVPPSNCLLFASVLMLEDIQGNLY